MRLRDLGRILRTIGPIGFRRTIARALRPMRGTDRRILRALGVRPQATLRALPGFTSRSWTGPWDGGGRFAYLGVERDLGFPPDWRAAPSRLWSYHLHYLDELRDGSQPFAARSRLLQSWVDENPFASAPGWEAFPTALRIVNALEFLASGEAPPPAPVVRSLAEQVWWLEGNLETDLGANHLFKNVVALAWAGRLLDGPRSQRWKRRGDALVRRELRKQLLPDGFHYERTPGYHAVLVDDLVRLVAVLDATGESDGALAGEVRAALSSTAAALEAVLHADGQIPLFNDSAFGQAPEARDLLRDARVALERHGAGWAGLAGGAPAAGYHRLEGPQSVVLLDAGEVSCDEQPGHAHADTLSFEASMPGGSVIVDAGVHDYEPSPERRYARSTAAHNTVEIDGTDQSEMWGVFRVGRRARPFDVARRTVDGRDTIEASHDGYTHLTGRPVHTRTLRHLGNDTWSVADTIRGTGEHVATGRVRLHPDLEVTLLPDGAVGAESDTVRCVIRPEHGTAFRLEDGWYFPRFGVKRACTVVRMDASGALPIRFAYRLELSTKR